MTKKENGTVVSFTTFLLFDCVALLMRTATKAIRQKRAAQVEVSREITRNGSTVTQMTIGRLARERRWAKIMRLPRVSIQTCVCLLRWLQKIVQHKHFDSRTAYFGTCSSKDFTFRLSC